MLSETAKGVRITFRLRQHGKLALSSFVTVAHETVQAIRELEATHYTDAVPSDWNITSISMRDILVLTLEPTRTTGLSAAGEFIQGLRMIKVKNKVPPRFSYRVFQHARKTLSVLDNGVAALVMTTHDRKVRTTPELVRRVDEFARAGHFEWTTLDGLLDTIKWDPDKPRFVIVDELTGRRTECIFSVADLERAKAALPHRVEVSGRARYSQSGDPVAIVVDEWSQIPPDNELPTLDDMDDVDITNGMDAAEYVWRLRHGG